MHPQTTRHDFLRLRVQGQSLASIGRQLGVSKPTLIKWSRQSQAEIHSRVLAERMKVHDDTAASVNDELAILHRRHTAVKQELLSRSLRDVPTVHLETLSGQLRQRIDALEAASAEAPLSDRTVPNLPEPQKNI